LIRRAITGQIRSAAFASSGHVASAASAAFARAASATASGSAAAAATAASAARYAACPVADAARVCARRTGGIRRLTRVHRDLVETHDAVAARRQEKQSGDLATRLIDDSS
jgi:hypothetical protein